MLGVSTVKASDVYGGFYMLKRKAGTWVNTSMAAQMWEQIAVESVWMQYNWVVKVDCPDVVFFFPHEF